MKRVILIFSMLALLLFPSVVHADVAPPINPPGSNPQPGKEATQVRMVAETVLIDVQKDFDLRSLGTAMITADFTMRNLGNDSESMAVRFPIAAQNGRFEYPEISGLKISVAGKRIEHRRVSFPDEGDPSQMIPWAEFDITFPPGQDVSIQVKYQLRGSGYEPYTAFYYILESGAGWKDTIGSADIILRLPYEASPQNVVMGVPIGWAETTPGGVFQGNDVRWHFENFEPGPNQAVQNMEFALVAPSVWNNLLIARANVTKSPNDSEAWGQLGKAYKSVFLMYKFYREDEAGDDLYKLAVDAYEKCLALNPNDAQWHAGFAELIATRAFWDSFLTDPNADVYRALNELRTALELAPTDPRVLDIADRIYIMFPEGVTQAENGYDFPWLTQTPTPLPPEPTTAPVYDPAALAGTYQSEMLTLANGKQTRLKLTLHADYSAELESKSVEEVTTSIGRWMDDKVGTISVEIPDSNNQKIQIRFLPVNGMLQSVEYPSFYGDSGVNMQRLIATTALPPVANTPVSAPVTPEVVETDAASKPPSSLPCGSAALAPLAVGMLLVYKRRQME